MANKKKKSKLCLQRQKKRRAAAAAANARTSAAVGTDESRCCWADELDFRPITAVPLPPPPSIVASVPTASTVPNLANMETTTPTPTPTMSTTSSSNNNDDTTTTNSTISLRIVSWNILAESYLSRRSHSNLPNVYQKSVFTPAKRHLLLRQRLIQLRDDLHVDVLCLQEVDTSLQNHVLEECGFHREHQFLLTPTTTTTTTRNGAEGKNGTSFDGRRVDACGIYVLNTSRWKLVDDDHEVVQLDDLATLGRQSTNATATAPPPTRSTDNNNNNSSRNDSTSSNSSSSSNNSGGTTTTNTMSSLQGLSTSLLRRNVAIICRLQHVDTGQTLVLANTHIFWNPEYEYVKLCQVHYVLRRAHDFCTRRNNTDNDDDEGIVLCGDLNSPSDSLVHEYMRRGGINAKRVAPWYKHWSNDDDDDDDEDGAINSVVSSESDSDAASVLQHRMNKLNVVANANDADAEGEKGPKEDEKEEEGDDENPQIRYIMDFTLNRFTRWLRILGIDAALETEEEEIQRTKENNVVLFDRCRKEKRTLVTTSYKLLLRKDCPAGTYLVNAKSLAKLEAAFVHLLLHHGVTLEPRNFLTRCVICNGSINDVNGDDDKRRVFAANNAPDLCDQLSDVYECDGCGQGYWWCDDPTSSASRVKNQATRLFELCLRGGVPTRGSLHMFDFVDVDKEREKGLEDDNIVLDHLDVIDWLKDESLSCPRPLESAYALRDENGAIVGECLPFTNVTYDFVGALDYIWFDTSHFRTTERLHVPTSFKELNRRQIPNGHLLPSSDWPSDHLAVGVQLEMIPRGRQREVSDGPGVQESSGVVSEKTPHDSSATDEPMYCGFIDGDSGAGLPTYPNVPTPSKLNSEEPGDADTSIPPPKPSYSSVAKHPATCACGCVPKILSMFEMAELRKQAKLKQAKIKAAARNR